MQAVIKAWYVVAIPDASDPKDRRTAPKRCSADFTVREAAEEYARLMRKWCKHPKSVEIKPVMCLENGL